MEIKAAVTHEACASFTIETVHLDPPNPNEILVKIKAVGVCHTDEAAQNGFLPLPLPAVLGHEGAGIVEAVGSSVTEIAPGDHVALTFGSCSCCEPCIDGRPYACENMNAINFFGVMADGTHRLSQNKKQLSSFFAQSSFAEYAVVNESSAVKIDRDMDFSVAAPFGCGVQTGAGIVLNRLRPAFGSSIAVFGCGTVGMSALMAAKIAGCENIVAVGGNEKSLALAKELGATHVINRKKTEDIPAEMRRISGSGLDYAIETSGVESMIKTALASLNYMGSLVTAGAGMVTLHTGLDLGARTIIGVTEGNSVPKIFIPKLIRHYQAGKFPVDKLIKRYPFEQINEAFADSHNGTAIKAVLVY